MTPGFNILFQDEHLVIIDKPSGFHVHPHEDKKNRVDKEFICLYVLKEQIGKYLYPVHRLDVATSGVLVFALSSYTAQFLQAQIQSFKWEKIYHAVVRGYAQDAGEIDIPLEVSSTEKIVSAKTTYTKLSQIELDHAVGKRFSKARYSLMQVQPHTGRYHQIRRHFNRIIYFVIGDREHGDNRHNVFFNRILDIHGLCLHSSRLKLYHPVTHQEMNVEALPSSEKWKKIQTLFNHEIKYNSLGDSKHVS